MDVSVEKLTATFANLRSLKGAIRVHNTSLKNLNFLKNLTLMTCDHLVMQFTHTDINDVQFLFDLQYSSNNCIFFIHNNVYANFSGFCQNPNYENVINIVVYSNKGDCGCLSEDYGIAYGACEATFGTITITNLTEQGRRLDALTPLKNMTGNLTVAYTSLYNLSMFSNLERIIFSSYENTVINIHNNPRMRRLGWSSLKTLVGIDGPLTMHLESLHRDFCLTKEELQVFTSAKTNFTGVQPNFCGYNDNFYENETWCIAHDMKELEEGCTVVFHSNGLKITTGDEKFVYKLENVTSSESPLIIEKTNLTDLSFLDGLEGFNYLNDHHPCINITSNKFLRLGASFPNLKNSAFIDSRAIVITNTPLAFDNATDCWDTQMRLNMPIVWDGNDCDGEPYNMTVYDYSGAKLNSMMFSCFVTIWFFS